jgi:radical SAM-linked protein
LGAADKVGKMADVPNPQLPVQQAPPVQRLRIRYAKRGRLRFTSHRDFGRAFERGIKRAGIPVAYSSGYSPHPRISYAGASPTGAASEAEYLEIGLSETCDPVDVMQRIDAALPAGLDVIDIAQATPGQPLADRLEAGSWRIELPGVDPKLAQSAVHSFLAADTVTVERMTKKGYRSFDCRGAVVSLTTASKQVAGEMCAILELVVRHETPIVRPDDVLAGLREVAGLEPPVAPLQIRLAQGPLDREHGTVGDPLGPDRDASD